MEQKEKPAKAQDAKEDVKEAFEKGQSRFAAPPRAKQEEEATDLARHKPEPAGLRAGREKPAAEAAPASEPVVAAEPTPSPYLAEHTVVSGDNLSYIAKHYYGTADKYMKIYEANKEVIGSNPSLIRVGQVLKIPRLD